MKTSSSLLLGGFCILAGSFALASNEAFGQENPATANPNVILVLADDLGAAELGCYGNSNHRTPNLDRFAASGLRLDTFYSAPLCTPTRVCLMTGQYGFRNGYQSMFNEAYLPAPDSPKRKIGNHFTIGKLMKSAGYATAMAGKWQLSGEHPTLIYECGFDEYRMWAYKHNLPQGIEHAGRWEHEKSGKTARFWHPCLVENGKYLPTKADDYGPDLLVDFILDFARRHKEKPFFVYHTSLLTHKPYEETPDPEHPGKRLPGGFKTNLEYLDHLMGRMSRSLDEMGLSRNTVVIFVGDNGTGGRGKGQPTEMGARVPMIVWGPEWIRPRKDAVGALGDITDIMPTLAELSGARIPKDVVLDGKSLVPLLRGETSRHREWIYSFLDDARVLRDDRWLLENPGKGKPERFVDCGRSRDGSGYKPVNPDENPEAKAARDRFTKILAGMPEPKPRQGAANKAIKPAKEKE